MTVEEPNHYQLLKITIYAYRAAISLLNLGERNFGWNLNSLRLERLERLLNRSPTLFFPHPLNLIDVAN